MEFIRKAVAKYLRELADKFDAGNTNISEEQSIQLLSLLANEELMNEFEVEFFLDIWFYCPKEYSYRFRSIFDDEDTKTINQSESYIFRKENDEWNYYLNSRGYDIDFDQG